MQNSLLKMNQDLAQPLKRKRVKKILKNIKEQVEFYFSDSNLIRDKFLLNLVGPNGNNYVSFDVLLTFNQLKQLGADKNLLQRALKECTSLQLSTDMNAVRRKSNAILPLSPGLDHSTIFIDRLPSNATLQWLKAICSKFGYVSYISLPHFKNGNIKGFAFVEFKNADDAVLACSVLNSPPKNFFPKLQLFIPSVKHKLLPLHEDNFGKNSATCQLSDSETPMTKRRRMTEGCSDVASKVKTVKKFHSSQSFTSSVTTNSRHVWNFINEVTSIDAKTSEKAKPYDNKVGKSSVEDKKCGSYFVTSTSNDIETEVGNACESIIDESSKPTVKSKVTRVNHQSRKRPADSLSDCFSSKRLKSSIVCPDTFKQSLPSSSKEQTDIDVYSGKFRNTKKKKRKRKRRCKEVKGKLNKESDKEVQLKAMMKTEWNDLRKAYLHEQRENYGKLKSILQKSSSQDPQSNSVYIKHHLALKKSAAENYLEMSDPEEEQANGNLVEDDKTKTSSSVFVPGVVVSITSLSVNSDSKQLSTLPSFNVLKTYFSQYGNVAYVDVNPGTHNGYIRFETSDAAQRAIMEEKQFGLCLLTSAQEEEYWDHLLVSRQLKRSRERQRLSGKQRLIFRAENRTNLASTKHIKFNHNFNGLI